MSVTEHATITTDETAADESVAAAATATIDETTGESTAAPTVNVRIETVEVDRLTEHEGNAREEVEASVVADTEFVASIRAVGVRDLLAVKEHPDGRLEVVDGHRRLCGARMVGRPHVPCLIFPAGDEARDYIDMIIKNVYRRNFTTSEYAVALFRANQTGATRPALSKITGLKPKVLKDAIAAGSLTKATRQAIAAYDWDFVQQAALKPFDDDPDAIARITEHVRRGGDFDHAIGAETVKREQLRRHQALLAKLQANGVQVVDLAAPGMVGLDRLADRRGKQYTPDTHASCPGHRALRPHQNDDEDAVRYICADPKVHGHRPYIAPAEPPATAAASTGATTTTTTAAPATADPAEAAARAAADAAAQAHLRDARVAWKAATHTRMQWLRTYLTRQTLPREVAEYVTRQMVLCANPVSRWLNSPRPELLADLLSMPEGSGLGEAAQRLTTAKDKRLTVIQLAVVAAANERAIDIEPDAWRWGQLSGQVARTAAAAWLGFLATLGYELSPIERALAEHREYTGEHDTAEDDTRTPDTNPGEEAPATDDPTNSHEQSAADEPNSTAADDNAAEDDTATTVETAELSADKVANTPEASPVEATATDPADVAKPTTRRRATRSAARSASRPADAEPVATAA